MRCGSAVGGWVGRAKHHMVGADGCIGLMNHPSEIGQRKRRALRGLASLDLIRTQRHGARRQHHLNQLIDAVELNRSIGWRGWPLAPPDLLLDRRVVGVMGKRRNVSGRAAAGESPCSTFAFVVGKAVRYLSMRGGLGHHQSKSKHAQRKGSIHRSIDSRLPPRGV